MSTEYRRYRVMVGASASDIRAHGEFRIRENRYVDGVTRGFYAVVNIL